MGLKPRRRGRAFEIEARVELLKGAFPIARVPTAIGLALGGGDEIQVRAVINGLPFYGLLTPVVVEDELSFYDPDIIEPPTFYELYLYKQMRDKVGITHVGDRLNIVLTAETYPRKLRGRLIRDP